MEALRFTVEGEVVEVKEPSLQIKKIFIIIIIIEGALPANKKILIIIIIIEGALPALQPREDRDLWQRLPPADQRGR